MVLLGLTAQRFLVEKKDGSSGGMSIFYYFCTQ